MASHRLKVWYLGQVHNGHRHRAGSHTKKGNIMADKTTTPDTTTEATEAPKFSKQLSTVTNDEQLVADLTTLSALKGHANPSEMTRAAVIFYRDAHAAKLAKFREFLDSDDE